MTRRGGGGGGGDIDIKFFERVKMWSCNKFE
jgi:hypothetical protein